MFESLNTLNENSIKELSFLWLEITEKCNLECLHCYANSSPHKEMLGHMCTDDWIAVIKQSAQLGCKQIQFIGGEPTIHPDLPRLISLASLESYTFIEVFTNTTFISESLLKIFVENNVQVATSFYSDEPQVHDKITKRPNSFNRTVNGIKRIIEVGLPIRVGIIEMEENRGHSSNAQRYLEKLGVTNISIDFQRRIGRGSRNIKVQNPLEQLCGECWKGKLCVTSSGKVYPCVFSRFAEIGQVKNGIGKIINSKKLKMFRSSLRKFRDNKGIDLCRPDYCSPNSSACGPESKCHPAVDVPKLPEPCQPDKLCTPDVKR